MADENRPKFPFLKKRVGEARYIKRNVELNPPTPADLLTSLDKTQTSVQSLPLIDNLSPIPKDQPATNTRPTTAETGDSGVRDVNIQVSPTYDSASVRTTVTAYHRESTPKSSEEDVQILEPVEECFQKFRQLAPLSARRVLEVPSSTNTSRTESYTSLDRIKTPPIPPLEFNSSNHSEINTPHSGSRRKSAESHKTSDYSAEIDAASRSKDSASVGTSKQHDASLEHENVHDTTFGPQNDSRYYGTSHHHHNSSLPPPQSQNYPQETPLNSRSQQLFKSHSSASLQYPHRKPYLEQTARRFGIFPVPRYVLPPRPRTLETPDSVNGLGTPQANSTKIGSFYRTPILPEKFVSKEEGKVVESLAEQLRALLILFDVGMDERKQQTDQLKYIYSEKSKILQQKEHKMELKGKEEEQKLIGAKAKTKLELDKMKQADAEKKNFENELKEVKDKYGNTARTLSDIRLAKNQMEQRLKKAEEELQKEREKAEKWKTLNIRLEKDLEMEKMKAKLTAKLQAQQQPVAPSQDQQPRQPLRSIPPLRQQNYSSKAQSRSQPIIPPSHHLPQQPSTQPQNQQQFQPQPTLQQQQPQLPSQRRLTNASTSSEASTSKHVHWNLPEDENHEIYLDGENFIPLRNLIPGGLELLHRVDDQLFIEEQYRRFGSYLLMKECKCEIIRYDNNDIRYCCLKDVKVNVSYVEEDGHITVTLPNGYTVKTFASMQLEIHRSDTNENSIVAPYGTRYEYFNVPEKKNQAIEVIYKTSGERQTPDGALEKLENLNTRRTYNDFVTQTENDILFTCPGFKVSRALNRNYGGGVTIKVDSNDSNKFWKITICPEHQVFYVKHYNGEHQNRCFYTERRCDHLKN